MVQTLAAVVQEHREASSFPSRITSFGKEVRRTSFTRSVMRLSQLRFFSPHPPAATTVQAPGKGEAFGWSWVTPLYRRHFNARTLQKTHALVFDAECCASSAKKIMT
jgi:hypothetical protein